jgi:hypothetical protein
MKLLPKKSNVRMLTKKDMAFHMRDSFTITHRAGIQISERCPEEWKKIIQDCVGWGFIEPVAYMREEELMWIDLKDTNE